jgi:hypothetical protein
VILNWHGDSDSDEHGGGTPALAATQNSWSQGQVGGAEEESAVAAAVVPPQRRETRLRLPGAAVARELADRREDEERPGQEQGRRACPRPGKAPEKRDGGKEEKLI